MSCHSFLATGGRLKQGIPSRTAPPARLALFNLSAHRAESGPGHGRTVSTTPPWPSSPTSIRARTSSSAIAARVLRWGGPTAYHKTPAPLLLGPQIAVELTCYPRHHERHVEPPTGGPRPARRRRAAPRRRSSGQTPNAGDRVDGGAERSIVERIVPVAVARAPSTHSRTSSS